MKDVEKMKTNPKPRQEILHTTWFGRHHEAFDFIERHFAKTATERVTAWVIGLGGAPPWKSERIGFNSTEHLEMYAALYRAKVRKFNVHATDISEDAIQRAKMQLQDNKIEVKTFSSAFQNPTDAKRRKLKEYAEKIGIEGNVENRALGEWPLTEFTRERFHFHGPGSAGNIFETTPRVRPNVVTCFNLAQYYGPDDQRKLAENIALAIHENGVVITTRQQSSTWFTRALTALLGSPEEIGEAHGEEKPQKILAYFRKPN